MDLQKEAIAYFKKYPIYERLFSLMKQKYASLGHLGGTFALGHLTGEETDILSGFLGMDLRKSENVRISFSRLQKALEKSRFGRLTWEEILAQYFGTSLCVNKEERLHQREAKDAFWKSCLADCQTEDVKLWLSELLLEQKHGYRIVEKLFSSDPNRLRQMLHSLIYALEHLPVRKGQKQLLPVFAAQATGNPHSFDDGTAACRLLLHYGAYQFGQADAALSGIEQRESLLYQMGILKDDLSNTCLAYGVLGMQAGNRLHEGLLGFSKERQALQMTLHTLSRLSLLISHEDFQAACPRFKVYIVENPAVFSYLAAKYPEHAFLCTTGQLKLASYAAMDLFPETYAFYYAGDFDPEGLQIAQGLKKRYGKRLVLWNYEEIYYRQAISDITLSPARLKKLEKIDLEELQEIKQCLLTEKKAAYQEKMLDSYVVG